MKVLFLDIDGVVNCATNQGILTDLFPLDQHKAFLVGKIIIETDAVIVLSSSWRNHPDGVKIVEKRIHKIYDKTESFSNTRGEEIQKWLDNNDVEKYAILDDDEDMLPSQMPNFFRTTWQEGLTEEIMNKIIKHLK